MTASMPNDHSGASYVEVMEHVSAKRSTKVYLEIGVNAGELMQRISADVAIGVDPEFHINSNIVHGKRQVILNRMTSDAFFSDDALTAPFDGKIDLAFLDGLHTFEYLLRDFYNTERLSHNRSLIVMHDCLPLNAEMADRSSFHSIQRGAETRFRNYWTGDVWKIVPILRQYRPDLEIIYLDAPPTGLVCITGLDPTSRVLPQKYLEIVKDFRAKPNDLSAIEDMYKTIGITQTSQITNDFDHSLFFQT